MTHPFTDIHTHKKAGPDTVSITNVLLTEFSPESAITGQYYSVGHHPWQIKDSLSKNVSLSEELETAAKNPLIVAIGEAGLDKAIKVPLELQKEVFIMQLRIAEKLRKPMIIHCVRAYQEILALRKSHNAIQPWILHGFNGSPQLARQCIRAGCTPSFGSAIMKDNNRAVHSLVSLGIEEFFLETDDSGLDIKLVFERAALLRQDMVETLQRRMYERFERIFLSKDK